MSNNGAFPDKLISLNPVETKRASEVIFEQVKELILSGQLKPGDRLPSERSMMNMLQRSRPTVREALRMLERSGFIRTIPGSNGAVVQEPSTRSIEQSMDNLMRSNRISAMEMAEYRAINDVIVAKWAAQRRTQEDIDAMDELLRKAETLVDNYSEFIKLDPEFHGLVARAAKNEVAYIIARVLSGCVTGAMGQRMEHLTDKGRVSMCNKVLVMHQNLVNAIARGDVEEAQKAMQVHIQVLKQDLIDAANEKEFTD